ncbi:MAG: hypothetical protein KBT88_03885 [Gammaproteobacteria bacterium]|nr:hypothetical protein [Gammaproteobacteria bacterium]MBQ0838903.1 hypothetical protein [Gammaproteobacteria bacterium]
MKDYRYKFCTVVVSRILLRDVIRSKTDLNTVQCCSPIDRVKIFKKLTISRLLKHSLFSSPFILFCFGSISPAFADPLSDLEHQQLTSISNSNIQSAFQNVSGITRVNVTAGTANLQQNSAAVAIIDSQVLSSFAKVKSTQHTDNPSFKNRHIVSAKIGPGAFNGARGMTSVNQSAGADNAQLNAMAVAVGGSRPFAIVEMDDAQLLGESQAAGLSLSAQAGSTAQVDAVTGLSTRAFNGARGVIQVNQAAGTGNLTSNSFTMSVSK